MSIIKKSNGKADTCKLTFIISKEIAGQFKNISLVGDFNNWDKQANSFPEAAKDGTRSLSIELAVNNEYQFRYVCDENTWLNEPEADKQVITIYGDCENSVVIV